MVRPCVASGFVELAMSGLASMTINQVPVVHLVQAIRQPCRNQPQNSPHSHRMTPHK
jgi:hypothetical protein